MRFKRGTVNDEIPTASMADIAFLLIIYFMVTTTFRRDQRSRLLSASGRRHTPH